MNNALLSRLVLACAVAVTGCASAKTVVKVGSAEGKQSLEENAYAGQTLYLQAFDVRGKDAAADKAAVTALKESFIDYLVKVAKYGKVVDAVGRAKDVPADALSMAVDVQPSHNEKSVSGMKHYAQMYTFGAAWSQRGSVTVTGNVTLMRARRSIGTKTWTCTQDYAFAFMGGVRTGPIEEAFKYCYEDTFSRVVIVPAEAAAIAQAQVATLVEEKIKAATKKEEKVFNSDVDKASYSREQNPDTFAVVVGIEKYQQIAQADFGERDALAVKEHLIALGVPQRNIVHLGGSLATRSNLEKYLESWLPGKVTDKSQVIFYFSGHGAPDVDTKQAYLMPWDGDAKFLDKTGFPLKRLYQSLNALPAKKLVVMLDSCFSGAGGRSVLPQGARPLVGKVDEGVGLAGRAVVLSASEGDEISLSEQTQGHGLFTYYLLKGLNEKHGKASLQDLYDFLTPRVQDAARGQNRDQTPKLVSALPDLAGAGLLE